MGSAIHHTQQNPFQWFILCVRNIYTYPLHSSCVTAQHSNMLNIRDGARCMAHMSFTSPTAISKRNIIQLYISLSLTFSHSRCLYGTHLRLVHHTAVGKADLQSQIAEVTFHRIDDHPQRHHQSVEQQQSAHQRYQLCVAQHFVLAHTTAAGQRKDAVHPIGFGEHRTECQREAGGQEVNASLKVQYTVGDGNIEYIYTLKRGWKVGVKRLMQLKCEFCGVCCVWINLFVYTQEVNSIGWKYTWLQWWWR